MRKSTNHNVFEKKMVQRRSSYGSKVPRNESVEYGVCAVPENEEIVRKLINGNCRVLMKSGLINVVQEDKVDIQTKFAPYRNCQKLARLWILQDLIKNHKEKNNF